MNPRDLRIGNYVHTDTIFNGMIESISAYGKVYCWGRDENWEPTDTLDSYGHHRISPVPITEEWLKRLGFKLVLGDRFWCNEWIILSRDFEICYTDGNYYEECTGVFITAVHSLQNLNFCNSGGEELTFNNDEL